jgi:hypothetical protein
MIKFDRVRSQYLLFLRYVFFLSTFPVSTLVLLGYYTRTFVFYWLTIPLAFNPT